MSTIVPTTTPADPAPNDNAVVLPDGATPLTNQEQPPAPPPNEPPPTNNGNGNGNGNGHHPDPPVVTRSSFYDLEAEHRLIASMLVWRNAVTDVAPILQPGDLSPPGNNLYTALLELIETGDGYDAYTLANHPLVNNPTLAGTLDVNVGTAWKRHARYLADLAHRRHVYETAETLMAAAILGDNDTIDQQRDHLTELGTGSNTITAVPVSSYLDEHLQLLEDRGATPGAGGIPTGLIDLDIMLGGLRAGQLIIVAGRPGMGKSDLAVQTLLNVTRHGHAAVIASIEMNATELLDRYLASLAHLNHDLIRDGRLSNTDWAHITDAAGILNTIPLHVIDDPAATIPSIRDAAKRVPDLAVIVVDYLQLLHTTSRRDRNREQEVAELSRALKRLARTLDVPVIAMAQLNRNLETRADKRPVLSDLRESGAIENDADVVLGLYRDDYYKPDQNTGTLEIGVLKQRAGPTGIVTVNYDPARKRIADLSRRL